MAEPGGSRRRHLGRRRLRSTRRTHMINLKWIDSETGLVTDIDEIRREVIYQFSVTARERLDQQAAIAQELRANNHGSPSRASPRPREDVILTNGPSSAFPGIGAFRIITYWMRENARQSRLGDGDADHQLNPLAPRSDHDIPLEVLVDVLAAADHLRLIDIMNVTDELRTMVAKRVRANTPPITTDLVQHLHNVFGYKQDFTIFLANEYWEHVGRYRLPRDNPSMKALLESRQVLGSVFESARLRRIHNILDRKLRTGDIFHEDIPYLIL